MIRILFASILALVVFLTIAPPSAPAITQTDRVYLIQRTERGDGVHVVFGFEQFSQPPVIAIDNGNIGTVSIQGDNSVYHGTIAARLEWCDSRLVIDEIVTAAQSCVWFPFGMKGK